MKKVRVYAPDVPDPTIDLFVSHEKICPLCHNEQAHNGGGELRPHKDCKVGQEAYLRANQRVREIIRGIRAS